MPQAQLFREPDAPDQPRGNEVVGGDDGPNIGGEAPLNSQISVFVFLSD